MLWGSIREWACIFCKWYCTTHSHRAFCQDDIYSAIPKRTETQNFKAWGHVSEGTLREDPGMSKELSGQHGQLCERDMKGGSQKGGSQDVLGIPDPPKTERTSLDYLRSLGQL